MEVGDLIRHFSTQTLMPIKINAVKAAILNAGMQDKIEFVGVEYDVSIIRGKLYQYITRQALYAEPELVSEVYYDKNQETHWRRLVCCKEMLHILDRDMWKAKTQEQVSLLLSKIVFPAGIRALLSEMNGTTGSDLDPTDEVHTLRALLDLHTDLQAVAVLFPLAVRERLLPFYEAKKLTVDDIALFVDLPKRYIGIVMSSHWPTMHAVWTKSN
jgi:hypothetical protein